MYRKHPLNPEFGRSRRMGFHLTAGLFFPLVAGGHLLYRSAPNATEIDYDLPVGVAGPIDQSVAEFTFSPHQAETGYHYGLRAISKCGAEESNTTCVTQVRFDESGVRRFPLPNAPYDLQATPISTTQTQLTWCYDPANQAAEPAVFKFEIDGLVDSATLTYSGMIVLNTIILTHAFSGLHHFKVLAETSEGETTESELTYAAYDDVVPPTPASVIVETEVQV